MKKMGLIIGIIIAVIIYGFSGKKKQREKSLIKQTVIEEQDYSKNPTFDEQLKIFESLGYKFNKDLKRLVFLEVESGMDRKYIELEFKKRPFSMLYVYAGFWSSEIESYFYTDDYISYALDYFNTKGYIQFMNRMGVITKGEINFKNINVNTDKNGIQWISFEVNGVHKKWKLERVNYIADSFVQRFSYLPEELKTEGKYTYFDEGNEWFTIDYATKEEQLEFNEKTSLNREWLGQGNHFSEPKE